LTREDPERELDALAMGCLLASARAEAGWPVAKPHTPAAAGFACPPSPPISVCAGSGWHIVCCATPYLRDPASTVGLGDTFTAGTMLVHAGPRRQAVLANLSGFLALSDTAGSLGGPSSGLSAANNMRS
jgi:ADP-dependent phosphofructokinase/glucokinase